MTIHLGIIGMGYAGLQHYRCAVEIGQYDVTAVAEPGPFDQSCLNEGTRVFQDWRRLIEESSVEAVSICTPHHLHAEMALAAFEAGKDVLLEKPLAATVDEARRIVAAAEDAGRVLLVEMTHRFYPPVQAAKALVAQRRLGQLFAVEDRIIQPVPPSQPLPSWMWRRGHAGGGVAMTNGIHMLDRVAAVCGQPLTFHGGRAGWDAGMGDVEDTAAMLLSLADGTPVQLLAAWPRSTGPLDDELTLYGTGGTLRVWAWRGWRFEPADGPVEEQMSYPEDMDLPGRARVGMTGALEAFAAAIRERRAPGVVPEDVLAAQELVDQFYQAVLGEGR